MVSNYTNETLVDRAREIAEVYTGTPLEQALLNNLEAGDLEKVRQLVLETENQLMAEAILDGRDEY